MFVKIEIATPSQLPAILSLIKESGLPTSGLGEHLSTMLLAAYDDRRVVACAALEVYGEHALLRSVAVTADSRGRGLGDRITRAALELACRLRVNEVYLLTETAQGFFARHGFVLTERRQVPTAVAQSTEFTGVRCASAVAMVKHLRRLEEERSPYGSDAGRAGLPVLSLRDLTPAHHNPGCYAAGQRGKLAAGTCGR